MAYCNWCMLESETEDVCVWCKRPLKAGQGAGSQVKNDLHYLRNIDDDPDGGFPVFAVLGGLVFLGLVIAAIFTFKPADKPQEQSEHWGLAAEKTPAKTPAADAPAEKWVPIYPASNAAPAATARYTPPAASGNAPSIPSAPVERPSNANHSSWKTVDQWVDASLVTNNSIYFETVDFYLKRDAKGIQRLVGDIVVMNDTYGNLAKGELWLNVSNAKYSLVRYDGTIDAPKALPGFSISSKASLNCHVMAPNYNPAAAPTGKRTLSLGAYLQGQPVKVQSDIVTR
jgi:hypothetical protein